MKYIGLDLDGVIADTDAALRSYLHKLFGEKISRNDITSFYYEDCLGYSEEKLKYLWKEFRKDNGWAKIDIIDEAKKTLKMFEHEFKYIIITSRPDDLYDVTKEWLSINDIPCHDLVVTSKKKKSEIVQDNNWNLTCFVEDRYDFSEQISSLGIRVFLLDYPWNQGCPDTNLIKRVNSWKEIRDHLSLGVSSPISY